ncbi:MAG: hypothetical protein KDB03_14285 [Planctomycetales bacterium]|nr:hypothetical protein [Planctomycetales bacterium]
MPRTQHTIAGRSLIVASILTVAIMFHHPTSFNNAFMSWLVHGSLMLIALISTTAVVSATVQFGIDRPLVLLPIISYLGGFAANVIAGTVNGFVAPEMFHKLDTQELDSILSLCWSINQNSAKVGIVGTSLGMLIISSLFSKSKRSWGSWVTTGISYVCCVSAVGAMFFHHEEIDVHAALVIYTLQAAWHLLVGIQLICVVDCDSL